MIFDVTSIINNFDYVEVPLIMGIYLKSHQSCLQILKFSGQGGGPLVHPPLGLCPRVSNIFAYIFKETMTAGHLHFQYSPLLQPLLITLTYSISSVLTPCVLQ
jgi:hypothetical protein